MRRWKGVERHKSDVGGDHLLQAVGASWHVEGELRRRAGLTELASVGGLALGRYYSEATGAWILCAESDGEVQAIDLDDGSTTDIGDCKVDKPPHIAPVNPRVYVADDHAALQVWDGVWSALRTAGIAAPTTVMPSPSGTSAGNTTTGVHLIRYRYIDSQSPQGRYRSDPSTALSYTVTSSNEELTFTINGTGSSAIKRSADPKVDTIRIEMTTADGTTYYVAKEVANSATSVVVDMDDDTLALQDQSATDGDFGHEPPPCSAVVFECRDRAFACVYHARTFTGCGVTNASASITGTGFSTQWAGRLVRVGTDTRSYVISSITATTITLTEDYAGSTDANATITVYPKEPNRVYWSAKHFPESYKLAERGTDVLAGTGDQVVGGAAYLGDPWFFGRRTMERLVYPDDPADAEPVSVAGNFGLWNQRCLVQPDEDTMAGACSNGLWIVVGGRPRWISRGIDPSWREIIDYSKSAQFHATFDPERREIRWFFVRSGESTPRDWVTLDLTEMRLRLDQSRQGLDASTIVADNDGRLRAVVSDKTNGVTWWIDGATDGVPTSSTGAYTGAGGGSTTSTQVNESLPTGSSDLTGCMLYLPSTGEEVAISSNTADTITHAALASAVTAGADVYVGAIPFTVETAWFIGGGMQDKRRPQYLHIDLNPSSTGEARVSIYRDFQASPVTWTSSINQSTPKGVSWTNGATYATIELDAGSGDGFIAVPMPAEWSRALKAKVEVLSPAGTVKILDIRFMDERQNVLQAVAE